MAVTTNNQITLVDVAQAQKEVTISAAFTKIDASAVPSGTARPVWAMGPGGFAGPGGANWLSGNASGAIFGINAAAGAAYNTFDFQAGGVSVFNMAATGAVTLAPTSGRPLTINHTAAFAGATILINPPAGTQRAFIKFASAFQWLSDSAFNNTADFIMQNLSTGNNVLSCSTTDLITLGSTNATGGAVLGVSGGKLAFYGVTPVARPAAYTLTNHVAARSLNESTATTAQVANTLGTVISDLQSQGLLQ